MSTSVSDSSSKSTGTSGASSTSKTSDTSKTSGTTPSSLDRDMSRVSTRDVQAEAASVTRGDLATDGVERAARNGNRAVTDVAALDGVTPTARTAEARPEDAVTPTDEVAKPEVTPLENGANGEEVEALQQKLTDLGYDLGTVDGDYGRKTQSAVRSFQLNNDLPLTGVADAATLERMNSTEAQRFDPNKSEFGVYPPGSPEQIALFQEAARQAGLPEEWASSPGLINLLESESGGKVGRPNYTYGDRHYDEMQWADVHAELRNGDITAKSSATGLGQLLLSNVDAYYPSGRDGIGNPTEEAIGMMRYIQDRYGTPDAAWEQYNSHHEGY